MLIRRMQVEGGFLDGLDVRFKEGLTVIIGGRGTGKSSIIELIRFCVNVRGPTSEDDAKKAREQALSVLEDGQVTLAIETAGGDMVVSRSANSAPEGLDPTFLPPLIFSQKDIELLGLSARGRLNIVDTFLPDSTDHRVQEGKLLTQIQSLTVEIRSLLKEADQIAERTAGADTLQVELARAEARAADISKTSKQLDDRQKLLSEITNQTSALSVQHDALRRAKDGVAEYRSAIEDLQVFGLSLDEWPDSGGPNLLASTQTKLSKAEKHIEAAYGIFGEVDDDIDTIITTVEKARAPLEERARNIRREIEGLKEGAGAAARQLAGLREQLTQLAAMKALRTQKLDRTSKVQKQRRGLLDQLDGLRESRCSGRQKVAQSLTGKLSPLVRIKIRQSAQLAEFVGAITNVLRGSGLRYNELALAIAGSMSPRELIEAAENYDVKFVSKNAKITMERAERVTSILRTSGSENIIGVALEDTAEFELLDGKNFKSITKLSVGQRCTVILSILLQNSDRVLIVDQPEDHLDNAFIANTLVGAIRLRSADAQLVVTTHNANIPVLGDAAQVILLGSNGHRGYVVHAAPLDDARSKKSISTVMEGGAEAFRRRAKFYQGFAE